MHQPVAFYIGLRYMFGRAADRFGRFVSWLSMIGITLGVMALVTVLSVMNGFERELQKNILNLMPHALLTTEKGSLDPKQYPADVISRLKGVTYVEPLTTADVVLQSPRNVAVGTMLGITEDSKEPLKKFVYGGWQSELLPPGAYQVILGEKLAQQLEVKRGSQIRLMVTSVSQFTPMGRIPSQRIFTVSDIFYANSEVDGYQLLVNQQDAGRIMRYQEGNVTGWRLYLEQPLDVSELGRQTLPSGLIWKDWRDKKGELFQAVRMEKNMMGLLLGLIIAVAAFNLITSLGLLVMEKQGEIAILQTQGLSRFRTMMIFMFQGATAGIIGSLIGALLGVGLALLLSSSLPFVQAILGGVILPVQIEPVQIVMIVILSILLSLLSTFYPSWRAAAVQPAEALRYE